MDKVVNLIQALSANEQDLKQLRTTLAKDEGVFLKHLSSLDDVINTLDPLIHSVGCAFVLAAKVQAGGKTDPNRFAAQAQRFILGCNPMQIRLVPAKFSQICRRFAEICIESGNALKAIKPLRLAIRKLRTNPEILTPIHADLLQACLVAKTYNIALGILNDEIFDVNPDITAVTPRDMLLYYYYGGMIFTGLKENKRALVFFKIVVTAPAVVVSAIMVEAYKKYVLLSLLVHGKVPNLPRYTSSVVQRHHKTAFPQYTEFANAYTTHNTDELHKCAETYSEVFQKDRNFGLVKQCIQSLYRKNIQRFTQTYLTFSLQDIAKSVNLSTPRDAEKQVLRMIENGEIFATVNQKDGMVSFHEDPEQYDTSKMSSNIDQQLQKVIDLGKKVRNTDEAVASSPVYIQKTSVHERGRWELEEAAMFDGVGEKM